MAATGKTDDLDTCARLGTSVRLRCGLAIA